MSARFSWDLPGLDKSRFEAYATLLHLRNGGQAQERSKTQPRLVGGEVALEDEDDNGAESIMVQNISLFEDTELEQAFQDRVAELASGAKGGHHVAATLLFRQLEDVKLVVAKNEAFDDVDRQLLSQVQNLLRAISLDSNSHRDCLWRIMVAHYNARIHDWMVNFQRVAKRLVVDLPAASSMDEASKELQDRILELFNRMPQDAKQTVEDTNQILVKIAHEIWSTYDEETFVALCTNCPDLANALRLSVGFLGRLRGGFNVMVRAAERLTNFHTLTICPLDPRSIRGAGKGKAKNDRLRYSLGEMFQSLSMPLNDQNVQMLFGPKWTKYRLETAFDKAQERIPHVHAETQLVIYASQERLKMGKSSGYIGCSKRSCFLCNIFLNALGEFHTRASHGKVYHLWTIPHVDLPTDDLNRFIEALKLTEAEMKNLIFSKGHTNLQQAKESTVGDSSFATKVLVQPSFDVQNKLSQYLMQQRRNEAARVTKEANDSSEELYNLDSIAIEVEQLHQTSSTTMLLAAGGGECQNCQDWTERICSLCRHGWFCSARCERGSVRHRLRCTGHVVRTADYLELAVSEAIFPDDPQTMEDYGFNRCETWDQKSHLFGLYQGLFGFLGVTAGEIDQWRADARLTENIINKFNEIPEKSRGGYYPWFLKHRHILALDSRHDPKSEHVHRKTVENWVESTINKATRYLLPEDQERHFTDLQPCEKRDSFMFFALILENLSPRPESPDDSWYGFGFCACADEHEEGQLGGIYNVLVAGHKARIDYCKSLGCEYNGPSNPATATFEELWRAYRSGGLIRLMDKYGFRDDRRRFRNLEQFLSYTPTDPRPLVWRLCHFLSLELPRLNVPVEALIAARFYGFSADISARTDIELSRFYKRLLANNDHLEVEKARCEGRLLQYAETYFGKVEISVLEVLRKLK